MPRPRAHRKPEAFARVTTSQIGAELGLKRSEVERLLRRHREWLRAGWRPGPPVTWDATVIEKLRGLLDQPHRQLQPPESDWLSQYLGVADDARRTSESPWPQEREPGR